MTTLQLENDRLSDTLEDWLAFSQGQGRINPIMPSRAPSKVIEHRPEIDDWPLAPSQGALPGVRPPAVKASTPSPGTFLSSLRMMHATTSRMRVRAGEGTLPAVLSRLAEEIEASWSLLGLCDDWDGDGSVGYERATWSRVTRFLASTAERIWLNLGEVIPTPDISPGPRGSIDLHWRTPDREMLINFPADENSAIRFYGDDGNRGTPIEGELEFGDSNRWVLMWLIRR